MPWVRIDDGYADHPKLAAVGPLGQALWLAGLAYCNRNLTDGFIPWSASQRLVTWTYRDDLGQVSIYLGSHNDAPVTNEYVCGLLVGARLWIEVPGGFLIHDYEKYQPTKAQIMAEREAKAAAGRAGGLATAAARGKAHAQAEFKPVPNPNVPNPVPRAPARDPNAEGFDRQVAATQRMLRQVYGEPQE